MALTESQQIALDIIEAEEVFVSESWITLLNMHPVTPLDPAPGAAETLLGGGV